jgi:hypothetical protein
VHHESRTRSSRHASASRRPRAAREHNLHRLVRGRITRQSGVIDATRRPVNPHWATHFGRVRFALRLPDWSPLVDAKLRRDARAVRDGWVLGRGVGVERPWLTPAGWPRRGFGRRGLRGLPVAGLGGDVRRETGVGACFLEAGAKFRTSGETDQVPSSRVTHRGLGPSGQRVMGAGRGNERLSATMCSSTPDRGRAGGR